ncbi:MAG: hypothetical protein IKX96_02445 [Firmicutes bacterium]|nr:hypothetical protein [Bacillota bacterium]
MKRFLCVCLCMMLVLGCAAPAYAAYKDLVIEKDTTINPQFAKYGTITVKSGATLTIRCTAGFEIFDAFIVEPGAYVISDGNPPGMFNFSMKAGSTVSGLTLYYKSKDDGFIKELPNGFASLNGEGAGFRWNTDIKGWVVDIPMQDAVVGAPIYHGERDREVAEQMAAKLNGLGLLKGAGTNVDGSINYELYRRGTRTEALVMLIRLLGKENEALSGSFSHTFNDVPSWADKYVGYAYENGLTKGVSAVSFGSNEDASMQMYYTFLLRALGQTDDSVWAEAFERAGAAGITSKDDDPYELCDYNFWRCDMVVASYRALRAKCTSGKTLAQKLIDDGVFTDAQYQKAQFWQAN